MTGRAATAAGMSEKELQQNVIELAKVHGWLLFHDYDSRRSQAGFPDLVMVRGPRLIFAELKSQKGRMSRDGMQQTWLDALQVTAISHPPFNFPQVTVWRPADWLDGTIEKVLA